MKRRLLAIILVIALTLPFFYLFIESFHGHEEGPEECSICTSMDNCRLQIQEIKRLIVGIFIILLSSLLLGFDNLFDSINKTPDDTLVSNKVRLDD